MIDLSLFSIAKAVRLVKRETPISGLLFPPKRAQAARE
jgi:hypothetical protein